MKVLRQRAAELETSVAAVIRLDARQQRDTAETTDHAMNLSTVPEANGVP
jgi:hypothetical protein